MTVTISLVVSSSRKQLEGLQQFSLAVWSSLRQLGHMQQSKAAWLSKKYACPAGLDRNQVRLQQCLQYSH
jgi:hypothetical protein